MLEENLPPKRIEIESMKRYEEDNRAIIVNYNLRLDYMAVYNRHTYILRNESYYERITNENLVVKK